VASKVFKITLNAAEQRAFQRMKKASTYRFMPDGTAMKAILKEVAENTGAIPDLFPFGPDRSRSVHDGPKKDRQATEVHTPNPACAPEPCGSPYEERRSTVTDADILALWKQEDPFRRLKDPKKLLAKVKASRPTLNHMEVSNDVILWWEANPSKRKTDRGLTRFLAGWWMRQKNGSEPSAAKPGQAELTPGWNREHKEQPHERRQREDKGAKLLTAEEILSGTEDMV
jgi:hypothetical protein